MKAGIVCCSNGLKTEWKDTTEQLDRKLKSLGIEPVYSRCLYEKENVMSGNAQERADCLMEMFCNPEIDVIYDISGGDIANEILPYLDYDQIAACGKQFWGYSDLTTVINALCTKTGGTAVLYQVKNLVYESEEVQTLRFSDTVLKNGNKLFDIDYRFVQGKSMSGKVAGGNIRCFLKLAGTEYWPDLNGRILLLEARSGQVPQMITYLSQLKQLGAFEKVSGILLGTFTGMKSAGCVPDITELVKRYAGNEVPVAVTEEIGHGADSKGIVIGKELRL